jgi:hypothetical protein
MATDKLEFHFARLRTVTLPDIQTKVMQKNNPHDTDSTLTID